MRERNQASDQLQEAAAAVSVAVTLLKAQMPTIEAYLKEARDMDNFGHIVDPTLWRDPTRRAVNAVVEPLFKAAVAFVGVHDHHTTKARDALAKVTS